MAKKKKLLIIGIISLAVLLITALIIWLFVIPEKLLEYTSDDGNVTVVISRPKIFGLSDSDYNIKIKKNDGIFGTTLLSENFEYDDFHLGQLDDSRVKIQWYDNHVEVLIGITKHNEGWHSFTAEF